MIILYFVFHGIMGESGVLKLLQVQNQVAVAQKQIDTMKGERVAMERRTKLLRPDNLDSDMLDERARATLGLSKPNEVIILLDKKSK